MTREEIEHAIGQHEWYQRIPLGEGLYTPGREGNPSEKKLALMGFPESLEGKTFLDIGCGEGFFCFEAERRGAARVVGVDHHKRKRKKFELVKKILGSRAEFQFLGVTHPFFERIGQFDVVLFLAVFHHLRHPFLAIDNVAAVTRGFAIMEIVEAVPKTASSEAALVRRFGSDRQLRMLPTHELLLDLLERAGFGRVDVVNSYRETDPGEERKLHGYSQRRVFLKAYR